MGLGLVIVWNRPAVVGRDLYDWDGRNVKPIPPLHRADRREPDRPPRRLLLEPASEARPPFPARGCRDAFDLGRSERSDPGTPCPASGSPGYLLPRTLEPNRSKARRAPPHPTRWRPRRQPRTTGTATRVVLHERRAPVEPAFR